MGNIWYTDGACSGNPGPGGFGVVCLNKCYSQTIMEYIERYSLNYCYNEFCDNTTNNREELKAILHVIKLAAADKENSYLVYSDSAYAVNCLINWCPIWAKNNWTRKGNKPILNLKLIFVLLLVPHPLNYFLFLLKFYFLLQIY